MWFEFVKLFAALMVAHYIADYPLQGDFLARAKNRSTPIPGVPWWQALTAHAAIHAGLVWLITASFALACAELLLHWLIDDLKCRGELSFNADQALHAMCKLFWAGAAVVAVLAGGQLP